MGEESGKFILGVFAVVLLFILIFKVAGVVRQNTKYEQAKHVFDEIDNVFLTLGEYKKEIILIESPRGWYLRQFHVEYLDDMPSSCHGRSCLCICPEPKKEECEKKGICRISNRNIVMFGNDYAYNGGRWDIISLEKVPIKLKITRDMGVRGDKETFLIEV